MNLNRVEAQSAIWLKIKQHLEGRIATLRSKNDGDLDILETAKLRGRIAELKALIALDESPVVPVADEQP